MKISRIMRHHTLLTASANGVLTRHLLNQGLTGSQLKNGNLQRCTIFRREQARGHYCMHGNA